MNRHSKEKLNTLRRGETSSSVTAGKEGKLGVVEEGAYAGLLIVDGNPLKDIKVLGANEIWIKAPKPEPIKTLRLIMKDGKIYKNTIM